MESAGVIGEGNVEIGIVLITVFCGMFSQSFLWFLIVICNHKYCKVGRANTKWKWTQIKNVSSAVRNLSLFFLMEHGVHCGS